MSQPLQTVDKPSFPLGNEGLFLCMRKKYDTPLGFRLESHDQLANFLRFRAAKVSMACIVTFLTRGSESNACHAFLSRPQRHVRLSLFVGYTATC